VADFETPELFKHIHVPKPVPGAMESKGPFVAKPDHQEALGFPHELVDNWEQKAVEEMGNTLEKYRGLRVFLDSCVKCGACTDKCHYYLGSADPKNMPVARQDLLRSVYRKYHTPAGNFLSKLGLEWLIGAKSMTREVLDDWYNYYHQCSECRRCSVYCPYGIDTAEITMAARDIMDKIGHGQKYNNEIIGKVFKIGNNLGLPEPALADTLEGLEEDIEDETGVKVELPLDRQGCDHRDEEPANRCKFPKTGAGNHLCHQSEHPDWGKLHHQIGDLHHHLEHTTPEVQQMLAVSGRDAGNEKPEQQAEEDQSQHLSLSSR